MHPHPLILASASPRRAALLRQIGFVFDVHPSHADETLVTDCAPREHVTILSERKAREVAMHYPQGIVLGADTIVVVDEEIVTKPGAPAEAVRMLTRLSGRKHLVYTGLTLVDAGGDRAVHATEETEVWFRHLEMKEILDYVAGGSPMDKAGAYGIQDDFGAVFVERICGCYYNVVGLPLSRFYVTYNAFVRGDQHQQQPR